MRRLTPHERDAYIKKHMREAGRNLKAYVREKQGMDTVTVRIVDLLAKLKENRLTHHETFVRAREGYRKHALEMFRQQLDLAEQGWGFQNAVVLDPPQDHTDEYDQAIEMLRMSLVGFVEPQLQYFTPQGEDSVEAETQRLRNMATIEISRTDFACFVRDVWRWKKDWFDNASSYITS